MDGIVFGVGDTVKHYYTKDILEISDIGTGNGKVSIGCVNATKSEWELVSNIPGNNNSYGE
ncbi:hypothetical protein D3C81_1996010 [compost metagenome]